MELMSSIKAAIAIQPALRSEYDSKTTTEKAN